MKVLWKIVLLLIVVLVIFYYMDDRIKENEPLESPVKHGTVIPVPGTGDGEPITGTSRPEKGLSLLVGKNADILTEEMGVPDRIEPSGYGYDWWIFNGERQLMVGVMEGKINQVYSNDFSMDISPFKMGQDVKDIYRFTIVESEVAVPIEDNVYTFTLSSEDVNNRLLIQYDNLYAQLYIDSVDGDLEAVRFIDPVTLVIHQPYDMAYMGRLLSAEHPSSTKQLEVDRAMERQIFELTNNYRKNHGVEELLDDYWLGIAAREHSEETALEDLSSSESPAVESLADRLKEEAIEHRKAGENIAFNYVDAIEAVHGWLNSPAHRSVLLDKDFTHLGTGAYGKYYTQYLIRVVADDKKTP
ncbi:CAP-associated domain-containing protein [Sporosarcina sp. FSL K6-1522]|uniref:CAP domain-containing protein n=1 Tax=Sporosarcina sp. FSL K6-1522 TaxID=2921554 RepID=UPI00315B2D90